MRRRQALWVEVSAALSPMMWAPLAALAWALVNAVAQSRNHGLSESLFLPPAPPLWISAGPHYAKGAYGLDAAALCACLGAIASIAVPDLAPFWRTRPRPIARTAALSLLVGIGIATLSTFIIAAASGRSLHASPFGPNLGLGALAFGGSFVAAPLFRQRANAIAVGLFCVVLVAVGAAVTTEATLGTASAFQQLAHHWPWGVALGFGLPVLLLRTQHPRTLRPVRIHPALAPTAALLVAAPVATAQLRQQPTAHERLPAQRLLGCDPTGLRCEFLAHARALTRGQLIQGSVEADGTVTYEAWPVRDAWKRPVTALMTYKDARHAPALVAFTGRRDRSTTSVVVDGVLRGSFAATPAVRFEAPIVPLDTHTIAAIHGEESSPRLVVHATELGVPQLWDQPVEGMSAIVGGDSNRVLVAVEHQPLDAPGHYSILRLSGDGSREVVALCNRPTILLADGAQTWACLTPGGGSIVEVPLHGAPRTLAIPADGAPSRRLDDLVGHHEGRWIVRRGSRAAWIDVRSGAAEVVPIDVDRGYLHVRRVWGPPSGPWLVQYYGSLEARDASGAVLWRVAGHDAPWVGETHAVGVGPEGLWRTTLPWRQS